MRSDTAVLRAMNPEWTGVESRPRSGCLRWFWYTVVMEPW